MLSSYMICNSPSLLSATGNRENFGNPTVSSEVKTKALIELQILEIAGGKIGGLIKLGGRGDFYLFFYFLKAERENQKMYKLDSFLNFLKKYIN